MLALKTPVQQIFFRAQRAHRAFQVDEHRRVVMVCQQLEVRFRRYSAEDLVWHRQHDRVEFFICAERIGDDAYLEERQVFRTDQRIGDRYFYAVIFELAH